MPTRPQSRQPKPFVHTVCRAHDAAQDEHECGRMAGHAGPHRCPCDWEFHR